MRKRLIFLVSILAVLSWLSFQESRRVFLAYQFHQIEIERKELQKQERLLRMEIHRLAPPDLLFQYWKEKCPHLVFPKPNTEDPLDADYVAQRENP